MSVSFWILFGKKSATRAPDIGAPVMASLTTPSMAAAGKRGGINLEVDGAKASARHVQADCARCDRRRKSDDNRCPRLERLADQ